MLLYPSNQAAYNPKKYPDKCVYPISLMCSYAYIMLDQTQIDLNRYFISPAKNYQEHIFFIYKG